MWFLFLLGKYPGVELLDYMVSLCLALWETATLLSKVGMPFYILASSVWKHWLLHILVNTGVITFWNFSHFSRRAVVFHCVFICFTQITSDVVHTAMCSLATLYLLLRSVYSNTLPMFKLGCLSSYWIISIWDTCSLSDVCIVNIFS